MKRVPAEHAFWNKKKRSGWFSSLIFAMVEAKDREALSDRTLLGPLWSTHGAWFFSGSLEANIG